MTMVHTSEDMKKPKGILKNSNPNPNHHPSPAPTVISVPPISPEEPNTNGNGDTKEITLQNTLQNAGRRRSSSATTNRGSSSRRTSLANAMHDENSPRLKWDEANLYLAEQGKSAKMKIDEPKTPYAPHYNPSEDEEEGEQTELAEAEESLIDAQDVKVDELDRKKKAAGGAGSRRGVAEDEIPELELGESEEPLSGAAAADGLEGVGAGAERIVRGRSLSNDSSKGEKHVVVGEDGEADGDHLMTTDEAQAKHREFEQHRKKHYEMRNIRELLAHPEDLDEMDEMDENDDDDDDDQNGEAPVPPPVPKIPEQFQKKNGA